MCQTQFRQSTMCPKWRASVLCLLLAVRRVTMLVDLSAVHLHFNFNFRIIRTGRTVVQFVHFICRFMFLLGQIFRFNLLLIFFFILIWWWRRQRRRRWRQRRWRWRSFHFNLSNIHSIRAIRISYFIVNLVYFVVSFGWLVGWSVIYTWKSLLTGGWRFNNQDDDNNNTNNNHSANEKLVIFIQLKHRWRFYCKHNSIQYYFNTRNGTEAREKKQAKTRSSTRCMRIKRKIMEYLNNCELVNDRCILALYMLFFFQRKKKWEQIEHHKTR